MNNLAESASDSPGRVARPAPRAGDDNLHLLGLALYAISVIVFVADVAARFVRMPTIQLLNWTADDGFYYLRIARHIAAGDGSTFDGIAPTNGYQPGWMVCVTVLARLFRNRDTLFHATVAMEFAFHIVCSVLAILLLAPVAGRFWSFVGGALWLFNPLAIQMALCMTESPFYVAGTLLALILVQRAIAGSSSSGRVSSGNLALVGAGLALALYGRADAVFLCATTLVALIGACWRSQTPRERVLGAARAAAIVTAVCSACLTPWLAYSWLSVHSFAQDSGVIKSLWQQPNLAGLGPVQIFVTGIKSTFAVWIAGTAEELVGPRLPATIMALAAIGVLLLAAIGTLAKRPEANQAVFWTAWLVPTTIATGYAYSVGIAGRQLWHAAEPAIVIWLIVFAWIALLFALKTPPVVQAAMGVGLASAGILVWMSMQATLPPRYPWQVDVYVSQPQFERMIPPNAQIGCFNAGIPAYFSNRRITNLDGLVNHDAVPYWTSRNFSGYVHDAHIGYIADEQYSMQLGAFFSRKPLSLRIVAIHPLSDPIRPLRYLLQVVR
jgi:hypothetical protein